MKAIRFNELTKAKYPRVDMYRDDCTCNHMTIAGGKIRGYVSL